MSAKDGSEGFDFTGTYTEVIEFEKIKYTMDKMDSEDRGRECEIIFTDLGNGTTNVVEEFDSEEMNYPGLTPQGIKCNPLDCIIQTV